MVNRNRYTYMEGSVIDVEEYHDGRYGAPGTKREKKKKATPEEIAKINHRNKVKKCRRYLLEYFNPGDLFITWTYEPDKRPESMEQAKKDFAKAIRQVRKEYKKRGYELYWIRNIEQGSRGAWHIHLVVKQIKDAMGIITDAWTHGGVYAERIMFSQKLYDLDFMKLASYITKDENCREKKKDGSISKPRMKDASWSHSRNMQLRKPKKDKLIRFRPEPKVPDGYYIERMFEGINPKTGYRYRSYTLIKLDLRI